MVGCELPLPYSGELTRQWKARNWLGTCDLWSLLCPCIAWERWAAHLNTRYKCCPAHEQTRPPNLAAIQFASAWGRDHNRQSLLGCFRVAGLLGFGSFEQPCGSVRVDPNRRTVRKLCHGTMGFPLALARDYTCPVLEAEWFKCVIVRFRRCQKPNGP